MANVAEMIPPATFIFTRHRQHRHKSSDPPLIFFKFCPCLTQSVKRNLHSKSTSSDISGEGLRTKFEQEHRQTDRRILSKKTPGDKDATGVTSMVLGARNFEALQCFFGRRFFASTDASAPTWTQVKPLGRFFRVQFWCKFLKNWGFSPS